MPATAEARPARLVAVRRSLDDVPPPARPSDAPIAQDHQAPAAPPARSATGAVNREIRIGDVAVELGEPLAPRRTVERAGSLLASLQRPALRPRRRL